MDWAGATFGAGIGDGEEEASLGWTATTRQEGDQWRGDAAANHPLSIDIELDDADKEDADPGEENGDLERSMDGWPTIGNQGPHIGTGGIPAFVSDGSE
jgi:hypothetical protein